jgi:hypothetical protein
VEDSRRSLRELTHGAPQESPRKASKQKERNSSRSEYGLLICSGEGEEEPCWAQEIESLASYGILLGFGPSHG